MYKEAIQDAISMHELPSQWRSDLLNEAEHVAKKKKTAKYRKDLRKLPFATIDGEDAKEIVTRHWSGIDNQFYDYFIKDYTAGYLEIF